jgi:large subunit ribosomal protein L3
MCEFPARVFKGKKMPGQTGGRRVTTQNLKIIQVRPEENLILVKGSVPGANGGIVVIKEALKKK